MTQEFEDRLAEAVHLLTETQTEAVSAHDDDGKFIGMHMLEHDSLIDMLIQGTGNSSGAGGNGSGVPIDAEAMIILDNISRTLGEWSRWIMFDYRRNDVVHSIDKWYEVHVNSVRDRHLSDEGEQVATETVEQWVRDIQKKFNPDKWREWEASCPKCGLRRITVNDENRFAIRLNVTQVYAECGNPDCDGYWEGIKGISELRYFANIEHDTPQNDQPTDVTNAGVIG
jgi:hypothetical protein